MFRRMAPLTAVCMLMTVAVTGVGASAASTTRHKCSFDLVVKFAPVTIYSGTPPISGKALYSATSDGTVCGRAFHGAARSVNTYPSVGHFTSKVINFGAQGSLSGPAAGTGAPQPDGSIAFSGKGKVTSGTGIYGRATGSYTFTGTEAPNSKVAIQHAKGSFTYFG